MNKSELLNHILKKGYFKKKENIFELFGIVNSYNLFRIEGKNLFLKDNDKVISFYVEGTALFNIYDKVTIDSDSMDCLDNTIETTIGRAFNAYILLEWGLSSKIKFDGKSMDLKYFTDITVTKDLIKGNNITIENKDKLSIAITFIRSLSRLFVISDTIKTMQPPPNIGKLKAAKIKELKEKYGEDALDNYEHLVTLTKYLQSLDDKWLENDPTLGILTTGKVKNVSRTKKHLIVGDEQGLLGDGSKPRTLTRALSDGYGNNPEDIAIYFDSIRGGSFARGNETKMGGEASNIITGAMSDYYISDNDDCGSKEYFSILVTEDNLEELDDRHKTSNPIIGKTVNIRTPMGCLDKHTGYCKKCVGTNMSKHKNGVTLMTLDIAGFMVDSFLAKMHGSNIKMAEIELEDIIIN